MSSAETGYVVAPTEPRRSAPDPNPREGATAGWAESPLPLAVLSALATAVCVCDPEGRITYFNAASVTLWGQSPNVGHDRWCGSWRSFRPDGSPLPPDECPMAIAIAERRAVPPQQIVIERPDGTRRHVLSHPQPLVDPSGAFLGAMNMLLDITERHRIEVALYESESRLSAMFRQAAVGITLIDLEGGILEANDRFCQIVGRHPNGVAGLNRRDLTHPDDWERDHALIKAVATGERPECSLDKRYIRGDGSPVWVHDSISALLDPGGRPYRMVGVVEDTTDQRQFRDELEHQVHERTSQLQHAHTRLRERERLAALGTLSAGLGHDLGNLILPLRARLEALSDPGVDLQAEVQAISRGLDYLQRLSGGLRLMAIDPASGADQSETVDLLSWWVEAEGVFRAVLLRGAALEAGIASGLPRVHIGRASLTQAVFNLVQNAAEALGPGSGLVSVAAEATDNAHVRITIADNGPGIAPEVIARCFEPYFSTKQRAISTGMGLSLVRSVVLAAGGNVSCYAPPGGGAAFLIDLRAAPDPAAQGPQAIARIRIAALRPRAVIQAVLSAMGIHCDNAAPDANLLITDAEPDARAFIASGERRAAVLCTAGPVQNEESLWVCAPDPDIRALRFSIDQAVRVTRGQPMGHTI